MLFIAIGIKYIPIWNSIPEKEELGEADWFDNNEDLNNEFVVLLTTWPEEENQHLYYLPMSNYLIDVES